jgi:hypothetical protein
MHFMVVMKQKILIIYDLKGKTNLERTTIIKKLYGHRDKSNYEYSYERKGILNKIHFEKTQKTIITLKNKEDLAKVAEKLKTLKVQFTIAKTQ